MRGLQEEYEQLAKQCRDFAVELLDQTRSSKELEVILNHDSSESSAADSLVDSAVARQQLDADIDDKHMRLSRLKLAIKCKQKRVGLTASPALQAGLDAGD